MTRIEVTRDELRDGHEAAGKVGRYGYGLREAMTSHGPVLLSRTGTVYQREERGRLNGGALRAVGTLDTAPDGQVRMRVGVKVRGKAARKAEKRARRQTLDALAARVEHAAGLTCE
jgi:hypothetical protein